MDTRAHAHACSSGFALMARMESEDALLGSYDSEASADDSQSETILSEDDDLGAEKATLESGKPFPKDVTEKLETLYSRGMNG